jgi:hypothetical protein
MRSRGDAGKSSAWFQFPQAVLALTLSATVESAGEAFRAPPLISRPAEAGPARARCLAHAGEVGWRRGARAEL